MHTKMCTRIASQGWLSSEAHTSRCWAIERFPLDSCFLCIYASLSLCVCIEWNKKFQHELSLRNSFAFAILSSVPSANLSMAFAGISHSSFLFSLCSSAHIILCLNNFRFRISIKITHCQWHLLRFMLNKYTKCGRRASAPNAQRTTAHTHTK